MATTATQRGKSQAPLLHRNFSSPPLKPWKEQRLLRCEMEGGEWRSVRLRPVQDSRRPLLQISSGDDGGGIKELREKLLVHLREAADKMKLEMPPISPAAIAVDGAGGHKSEPGQSSTPVGAERPWNLRTRRIARRSFVASPAKRVERTVRLRSESSEKKVKKQIFSVSLSHEEIEEDVFALTGSRPRRRPKKRPRNVQWQLDTIFPGLWLSEITPELYKVAG